MVRDSAHAPANWWKFGEGALLYPPIAQTQCSNDGWPDGYLQTVVKSSKSEVPATFQDYQIYSLILGYLGEPMRLFVPLH